MLYNFSLEEGVKYDKYHFVFWGQNAEMSLDWVPNLVNLAFRNMGSIIYKRMAHLTIPYKGEGPHAYVGCEPVCTSPNDPELGVLYSGQGVMKLTEMKSFIRKTFENVLAFQKADPGKNKKHISNNHA